MTLRMETGHPVTKDQKPVDGDAIRFIAEDGRCLFEVRCGKDGRSIEVSAVDLCKVDGKLYSTQIQIQPRVSNSIRIATERYP